MKVQIKRFRPELYSYLPEKYEALKEHHKEETTHLIDRLGAICDEVGHIVPPESRCGVRFVCMACKEMFDLDPHTSPHLIVKSR